MSDLANDVSAVNFVAADSPDTAVTRRTRVVGMSVTTTGTAGSVELKDGSGGTVRLKIVTPAAVGLHDVVVPGDGILFNSEVYCTLANVTSVTIFYA